MKNYGLLLALLLLGCSPRYSESLSTVVPDEIEDTSDELVAPARRSLTPTAPDPTAPQFPTAEQEQVVSLAPVDKPVVRSTTKPDNAQTVAPTKSQPPSPKTSFSELSSLPPKKNDWKFFRVRSKSNEGRITHVLLQQARVNDHPKYPPVLGLRCKNESLAVIVNFHEVLGSTSTELQFKFDEDEASHVKWKLTKLNDAAILHQAGPFIQSLLEARQLRISLESKKGKSFFAEFNLKGLEEELASFPAECRNRLEARQY